MACLRMAERIQKWIAESFSERIAESFSERIVERLVNSPESLLAWKPGHGEVESSNDEESSEVGVRSERFACVEALLPN